MAIKLLYVCFLVSCFFSASAQRRDVYYCTFRGAFVETAEEADFVRIISEPDSGSTLANFKEYYKDGKIKLIGKISEASGSQSFQGSVIRYFKNGKRQQIVNYDKGRPIGNIFDYYPSGKLFRTILPIDKPTANRPDQILGSQDGWFLVLTLQDSTGNEIFRDGSGQYIEYSESFDRVRSKGTVKNHKKVGEWTGQGMEQDSIAFFKETYDNNGHFIGGTTKDLDGTVYPYKDNGLVNAEYPGGQEAFNRYVYSHIKFPESAKQNNVEGRVLVVVTVEKDGSLGEFKIHDNPGAGLGEEAIRVLSKSPKWKPALRYGRPVKMGFVLPVNFSSK